jgi:hypothetical protein
LNDRLNAMDEQRRLWDTKRRELWPAFILLVLASLFFFSFFNRFAGLRSGDGEFGAGIAFLVGRRPYRDYFTAGPPLNQLKAALELGLFGKFLFVSRFAGVVERLITGGLLYVWLRKSFSLPAALLASFVTIIVSAGDKTDPIASYNHDAIFFGVLCGFLVSKAVDATRLLPVVWLGAGAGAAAGLSFLTKQTVGAAVALSMLVFGVPALCRTRCVKAAFLWAIAFLTGAIVPVVATGLFLWRMGILRACLTMLFVTGPAAKASRPFLFLSREWMIAGDNWVWLALAAIAIVLSGRAILRSTVSGAGAEAVITEKGMNGLLFCCAAVVVTAELLAFTSLPALVDFGKSSVYYALLGCAILGIAALLRGLFAEEQYRRRALQISILAALSWSIAASLSLSFPAFEAMTLPGLGLLLAAAWDGCRGRWGTGFLGLVMAAMVFLQIREKLETPFSFDHEDEPAVRFDIVASDQPELKGMRFSAETVQLTDAVTRTVRTQTDSSDTIFTFPEMGIFYSLTGRFAPTWTDSHNMDVVQDSFARQEAVRLRVARPKVLIYARPSEQNMQQDERVWREGRPSGQRAIIEALDEMLPDYRLVDTYQLRPGDNPIRLYVRIR